MAARTIATTDTLETFRTQFNALSETDFGDIATLDNAISATSVIGAVNELYSAIAGSLSFNITDGSNTQTIANAQTITISGTANQVTAVVSATDTLTLGLASNITVSGTTHALGTIAISGNTISSSDSATVTIDDNLSLSAGKTFTVGTLSIDETSGFPRISSTRGDKVLIVNATPAIDGSSIIFEGTTSDDKETVLTVIDPTADRTVSLPDATGTIVLKDTTDTLTNKTLTSPKINENVAVSSTATELNIMDGSATIQATVTLAGTDGVVISDGDTMKQALVSDFDTYGTSTAQTLTNKTLDLTTSGNKIRANFAGTGALPNESTYEGMFAYDTTGDNPYVADAGGWAKIITENAGVGDLSNVNISGVADSDGLVWSSAQGRFNAAAIPTAGFSIAMAVAL